MKILDWQFQTGTEIFQSYTQFIIDMSHGNEMMSGILGASILAGIVLFLKSIPQKFFNLLKRNIITSFSIVNAGDVNEYYSARINTFLSKRVSDFSSRSLSFNPKNWHVREKNDEHNYTSVGYGTHWFFWKKRFFWVRKEKLDSGGSNIQKEEITISTFGRSHKPFYLLAQEFSDAEDDSDGIEIYTYNYNSWNRANKSTKRRGLESIILDSEKKNEIISNIDNFKNNKEWFQNAGLPYKLTYVLYGVPGTGKTSIIRQIASHYNMKLCILNINTVDDKSFQEAIQNLPNNSLLAIEDFDSNSATKDRGIEGTRVKKNTLVGDSSDIQLSGMTLSGLLNSLDGLIPLDNTLIFLTTNSIETIDPALYRKGRVDYLTEIGEIHHKEILEYSKNLFKDYDFNGIHFKSTLGCSINEAIMYSRGSAERYVEFLKENDLAK